LKDLAESRIAIVGLGLMGGSLAGALRRKCREVIGVARRQETITIALRRQLIDEGTVDVPAGIGRADVIVLATPVRVILQQLVDLAPFLVAGSVVMDLGSTKVDIANQMSHLPQGIQVLGAHPMCGKEASGIDAADPALFQGHPLVLTPLPRTSDAVLALGRSLAEAVGSWPLILEPQRHDELVGLTSHLPYLLACSLVGTACSKAVGAPEVWKLASSGFRDTSRLAASDVTMMLDILMTNRIPVLDAVNTYRAQLDLIVDLLDVDDEEALRSTLADLSTCRRELFQ